MAYWLKKSALPEVDYSVAYWKLAGVTDDPVRNRVRDMFGGEPGKITFGKISKFL